MPYATSALLPEADIHGHGWNVRFVPIATEALQQTTALFDHLVGAGEQLRSNLEIRLIDGFKAEDQFLSFSQQGV
jgi:hypothetical protein